MSRHFHRKSLLILYVHLGMRGEHVKRSEAVALLKELSAEHLIQPSWVLIQQRKPDDYQLCFKGDYDIHQIEVFLENRTLSVEEDTTAGYLCIFKT